MSANRLNLKLFTQEPIDDTLPFVALFQRWIRNHSLPGVWIDVANYSHVHHAPAIILIGHEADLTLDLANGRFALKVTRKRQWPSDSLTERLQLIRAQLLAAAQLLEQEESVTVRFNTAEFELDIPDRLNFPNEEATASEVAEAATAVFAPLTKTATTSFVPTDLRQPFTLRIQLSPAPIIATIAPLASA